MDLPRSGVFYEDILGLSKTTILSNDGEFLVEYEIGPQTLAIGMNHS
jgi:hypothetical protein